MSLRLWRDISIMSACEIPSGELLCNTVTFSPHFADVMLTRPSFGPSNRLTNALVKQSGGMFLKGLFILLAVL